MKTKILCVLMMISICFVNGQNKKLEKALEKEVKTKLKEYQKGGWIIDGSRTLEVALYLHFDKLNKENNREMTGVAIRNLKSRNVCQQNALNNAMVKYAQEAKAHVSGRVVSDLGIANNQEIDKFYGAYERLVSASIEGELVLSFAVYKKNEDGIISDYEAHYIINENEATKMRIKAMEAAAKESQLAQEYANKISDFVKDGFK